MGLFSRREKPIEGRVTIRIPTGDMESYVNFTLSDREKTGGSSVWHTVFVTHETPPDGCTPEQMLQDFANTGATALVTQVPSVVLSDTRVRIEKTPTGFEVIMWGRATYLASEVDRLTAQAARAVGQTLS